VDKSRSRFSKPALTVEQQVDLLVSRGLRVDNRDVVSHYLKFIGYYRLSAYCIPFQDCEKSSDNHQFKPGISFEQVLDLYIFDRKLRLLIMDAVERIEVAIKAAISNVASVDYGSHWFLMKEPFKTSEASKKNKKTFNHDHWLIQLKKDVEKNKSDIFIQHYMRHYDDPELPPSWMIFETLSLGTVSLLYKSLELGLQKKIAGLFSVPYRILESWLHTMSYLRNLCAHHSRIWNRTFTIKPKILNKYKNYVSENNMFFAQVFVIIRLLRIISQDSHWEERLERLLKEHPKVDRSRMGFPENWMSLPIWE
jgi:abortive infection bacteriophage resistance protein